MPDTVMEPDPRAAQPGRTDDRPTSPAPDDPAASPRGDTAPGISTATGTGAAVIAVIAVIVPAVLAFVTPTLQGPSWVPYSRAVLFVVLLGVLLIATVATGTIVWVLVTR